MTKEEALGQLIHSLPTLYYFIRPHTSREFKIVKRVGLLKKKNYKKKESIELNSHCYSTLWLIETLIKAKGSYCESERRQGCKHSDVKNVFLWRYSDKNNTFEQIMDKLAGVGLINQRRGESEDRRESIVILTDLGITLLEELRQERMETLKDLIDFVEFETDKTYKEFVTSVIDVANKAWKIMSERKSKLNTRDV